MIIWVAYKDYDGQGYCINGCDPPEAAFASKEKAEAWLEEVRGDGISDMALYKLTELYLDREPKAVWRKVDDAD